MRYAIEKWKRNYWKVIVYDDDAQRIIEVASLYSRDGLYVNGTISNPGGRELFLALAYRLADAAAGGSNISTVREIVEDVVGGQS